jgi:RNA-directed DNA polymerase
VSSILSLNAFAWRLGVPLKRLEAIGDHIGEHYSHVALQDKKRSKVRHLWVPDAELMEVQRRIKSLVLDEFEVTEAVHGSVRGRSPASNASQHLGQSCVVTLDVRDFFTSVRHYIVYRMVRHELGMGRDVARLLTRLTTFRSYLPQGAPTSPSVANLVLAGPFDEPLSVEARKLGVTFTRFVDDIALSGPNARLLINAVPRLLSKRRLPIWRNTGRGRTKPKLKIMSCSKPQEVTGLIVNANSGPSLSRCRRDRIRAAIFELRYVADDSRRRAAVDSIRGRISYVQHSNPGAARRLRVYLDSTVPLLG